MNLSEWLDHIQCLHNVDMDLSLERVSAVAQRLNLLNPDAVVITVGGTNGKGSTVAGLESIYLAQGYQVGAFTSPYLIRYNEYVRLQGQEVTDEKFCAAFEKIEAARQDITLTPFEVTALAAFWIFHTEKLDIWILEVGLGGRFDAVNAIDADIAIVTSIGLDHTEWLGPTRESIAFEKAGIFRPHRVAICGDLDPPVTLIEHAQQIEANLWCLQDQFGFEKENQTWRWFGPEGILSELPLNSLVLSNMACVVTAVQALQNRLPVTVENIKKGLLNVSLTGRIQVVPGVHNQIWDVSHNPHAAGLLAAWLNEHSVAGKTRAVFSMLKDKDILGTLALMKNGIDEWYIADLQTSRSASLEMLLENFKTLAIEKVFSFETIQEAYQSVLDKNQTTDRVVVFGSFHTVGAICKAQSMI